MRFARSFFIPALIAVASLASTPGYAAEPEVLLVIKNHRFSPAEVKVPAGQRIKLIVDNRDEGCRTGTPPNRLRSCSRWARSRRRR